MTYKNIPEFENYSINEDGVVLSHYTGKERKAYLSGSYLVTKLRHKGKSYTTTIHRILARTFLDLDSFDSDKEVDHIDGNTLNNSLDNLQVLTVDAHKAKTHSSYLQRKKCLTCGTVIPNKRTVSDYCELHRQKEISIEAIEYWVTNFSWRRASSELGLTDAGLRKRYLRETGTNPSELTRR